MRERPTSVSAASSTRRPVFACLNIATDCGIPNKCRRVQPDAEAELARLRLGLDDSERSRLSSRVGGSQIVTQRDLGCPVLEQPAPWQPVPRDTGAARPVQALRFLQSLTLTHETRRAL